MTAKFLLGVLPTSILQIFGWMFLMLQPSYQISCPPPDFPLGGRYTPVKSEYELMETVTYACNGMMPLLMEGQMWTTSTKEMTCQPSGKWSRGSPFCEIPTKLISEMAFVEESSTILSLFDGNTSTCRQTGYNSEDVLNFSVDRTVTFFLAVLCFGEGRAMVKINVSESDETTVNVDSAGSTDILCYYVSMGKAEVTQRITVHILADSSSINTCEMKFFSIDTDEWCITPPENFIANGHLEVSRNRAILHCNEGFKARNGKNVYATCNNSEWLYDSLRCVENSTQQVDSNNLDDTPQKDDDILAIVVGTVAGTVILFLFGLTIFLIKSKKIKGICSICKEHNSDGRTGENRNDNSTSPSIGNSNMETTIVYCEVIKKSRRTLSLKNSNLKTLEIKD